MDVKPNTENEQPNAAEPSAAGQPAPAMSGAGEQAPAAPADSFQPAAAPAMAQPPAQGVVNPQVMQSVQPMVAPQPFVTGGPMPVGAPAPGMGQAQAAGENPEKNYLIALVFSYLLGGLGIDRFYLGYIVTGILKLITFGGFGIWHFIDLLRIALGKLKEKNNPTPLEGYGKYHSTMKPIAIVLLVIEGICLVGAVVLIILNVVLATVANNNLNNSSSTNLQPTSGQTLQSN